MLNKTIKGSDFDSIFTEVSHYEKLGLINPEQLRQFYLNVMNNRFVSDDLQSFIRKNIGIYVFSRAKLEQFRTSCFSGADTGCSENHEQGGTGHDHKRP